MGGEESFREERAPELGTLAEGETKRGRCIGVSLQLEYYCASFGFSIQSWNGGMNGKKRCGRKEIHANGDLRNKSQKKSMEGEKRDAITETEQWNSDSLSIRGGFSKPKKVWENKGRENGLIPKKERKDARGRENSRSFWDCETGPNGSVAENDSQRSPVKNGDEPVSGTMNSQPTP